MKNETVELLLPAISEPITLTIPSRETIIENEYWRIQYEIFKKLKEQNND